MFLSAYEDDTGVLDIIEEKIARATMLPRSHGEVLLVFKFINFLDSFKCQENKLLHSLYMLVISILQLKKVSINEFS